MPYRSSRASSALSSVSGARPCPNTLASCSTSVMPTPSYQVSLCRSPVALEYRRSGRRTLVSRVSVTLRMVPARPASCRVSTVVTLNALAPASVALMRSTISRPRASRSASVCGSRAPHAAANVATASAATISRGNRHRRAMAIPPGALRTVMVRARRERMSRSWRRQSDFGRILAARRARSRANDATSHERRRWAQSPTVANATRRVG